MSEEQYICVCGKSFQTKKSLSHHKIHCKCFQQQKKENQLEQLKIKQLPNGMFKCENCGKEHDGSYGSGRFCSKHCKCSYIGKVSTEKRIKNGTFVSGFSIATKHVPKAFNNWKCKKCGQIFRTRRDLEHHRQEFPNHRMSGSMLKGQTKFTSDVVAKTAKTLKQRYASGELVSQFKGKHLPKSAKEKLSLIISKRNELIQGGNGGRKDVKWYKVKNLNDIEYIVRGHWEENVAKRLNELGILWLKNQRISYIINGITKQYNPDFYLPQTNEFIEVKGWFKDKDRIKMNTIIQQHPNIRIFFIDNSVYQTFITNGNLNDKMLYTYR